MTLARTVGRFVGAVLATTGALLLVDVAVTLAWKEPISAITSSRVQRGLEDELARSTEVSRRETARLGQRAPQALAASLARRARGRLREGQPAGRIVLPTVGERWVMVEGIGTEALRKGPGHYPSSPLPGQGGTVAVAGHRTTYGAPFRPLDELRPGEPVIMDMPYGRFTYAVERTRIVRPDALWVLDDVGYEQIVLTACHPVYSAAKRIVVFARLMRSEPIGA